MRNIRKDRKQKNMEAESFMLKLDMFISDRLLCD